MIAEKSVIVVLVQTLSAMFLSWWQQNCTKHMFHFLSFFLAFSLCFHVTVPQPTGKHESNELHNSNLMLNWKRSPFSQICHIRETHAIFANPLLFSAKWFSGISFLFGLVENQSLVD
jgi:hypothetical protein